MRGIGGGDTGNFLELSCVPDSTFKDEITTLMANNENVEGRLVKLTWVNNYEVTSPASGDVADGEIITCEKDNEFGYLLGVRMFHYTDDVGGHHTPVLVKSLKYSGLVGLKDAVAIAGDDYTYMADGGTGGWGAVVAKHQDTQTVDVLF